MELPAQEKGGKEGGGKEALSSYYSRSKEEKEGERGDGSSQHTPSQLAAILGKDGSIMSRTQISFSHHPKEGREKKREKGMP